MKLLDTSCIVCLLVELDFPKVIELWKKEGYVINIPAEVYDEIIKSSIKSKLEKLISNNLITVLQKINYNDIEKFQNRYPNLGLGEIAIILHSIKNEDEKTKYYAILDDSHARKAAKQKKIKFTGSYGLIKALKTKGLISLNVFNELIKKMEKSNFRINIPRLENGH